MTSTIAARVSEEVSDDLNYLVKEKKTDKSSIVRELLAEAVQRKLLEVALEKYSKRDISLGKAAKLAKLPLADFMKEAADKRIPIISLEEARKDMLAAIQ